MEYAEKQKREAVLVVTRQQVDEKNTMVHTGGGR